MTMPNTLAHFSINADNIDRACAFYEKVFGWTFKAWGPPGFYQIEAPGSPVFGALLERSVIVGVGTLMFFQDPEGNSFGAMQYDAAAE